MYVYLTLSTFNVASNLVEQWSENIVCMVLIPLKFVQIYFITQYVAYFFVIVPICTQEKICLQWIQRFLHDFPVVCLNPLCPYNIFVWSISGRSGLKCTMICILFVSRTVYLYILSKKIYKCDHIKHSADFFVVIQKFTVHTKKTACKQKHSKHGTRLREFILFIRQLK